MDIVEDLRDAAQTLQHEGYLSKAERLEKVAWLGTLLIKIVRAINRQIAQQDRERSVRLRRRLETAVALDRAESKATRRGLIVYRHVYYQLWTLFPGETARWHRRPSGHIDASVWGERFGPYEYLPKWHDHTALFRKRGWLTQPAV